jgi:hypothetical protein
MKTYQRTAGNVITNAGIPRTDAEREYVFPEYSITASNVPVLPQAQLVRGNPLKPLAERRIFDCEKT